MPLQPAWDVMFGGKKEKKWHFGMLGDPGGRATRKLDETFIPEQSQPSPTVIPAAGAPSMTSIVMSEQAMKAGGQERKRVRRRRGSTVLTTPGTTLTPATTLRKTL